MKFHQAPPCSEMGPGDGLDPRYDNHANPPKLNRKALQLCAQVKDILNLSLSECADERIQDAYVESVLPNPDSMHLLVVVVGRRDTLEWLQNAAGKLRSDVAAGIYRKKTPQLFFHLK